MARKRAAAASGDDPLLQAIEAGDEAGVRALLAGGADPETRRGKTRALELVPHRADGVAVALIEAGADPGDARSLVWAVTTRRLETVQAFLRRGRDPNELTLMGTPLQVAAGLGDLAILEALIAARADLDAGSTISTPLLAAIQHGQAAAALRLIEAGADPRRGAETSDARPVHAAAAAGLTEVVRALLRAGADPNPCCALRVGLTEFVRSPALVAAARNGHAETVAALLEAGAEPFARDEQGQAAIERATDARVREVLARAGADVVPRSPDELLLLAAEQGDLAGAQAALDAGASPDARDARGTHPRWTPLMHAAEGGHPLVLRALLEAGADPALEDAPPGQDDAQARRMVGFMGEELAARQGHALRRTALHWAALTGRVAVCELLLERGAPRDARDLLGNQALHLAAREGHGEVVRLLLERGADPESKGEDKATALALATRNNHGELARLLLAQAPARAGKPRAARPAPALLLDAAAAADVELVRSLLAAGADPNKQLRQRGCALALAAGAAVNVATAPGVQRLGPAPEEATLATVRLLLEVGADPNGRGYLGAALYHAALIGHPEVVRALLAAGADPRGGAAQDTDTPLHIATLRKDQAIVDLLRAAQPRSRRATPPPKRKEPAPPARKPRALKRPSFARAGKSAAFRAALEALGERCGAKPGPFPGLAGAALVHVATKRRQGLDVEALQAELLPQGCFVCAPESSRGAPAQLAAFPTRERAQVIAAMQTNGANYDLGPGDVLAFLEALEQEHPFVLTTIGHDVLAGRFLRPPGKKAARALAARMYEVCPDIVDQGCESVDELARELGQGRLYLWWD